MEREKVLFKTLPTANVQYAYAQVCALWTVVLVIANRTSLIVHPIARQYCTCTDDVNLFGLQHNIKLLKQKGQHWMY